MTKHCIPFNNLKNKGLIMDNVTAESIVDDDLPCAVCIFPEALDIPSNLEAFIFSCIVKSIIYFTWIKMLCEI